MKKKIFILFSLFYLLIGVSLVSYAFDTVISPMPTETISDNAHPSEPLEAVEFKFGNIIPNPEDHIVNVAASDSAYLQPSIKVDSADVGKEATLILYIYLSALKTGFWAPYKTVILESVQKFENLPKSLKFSDAVGLSFDVYYGYRIDKTLKFNTYRVKVVEANSVPDCSKYTDEDSCKAAKGCTPFSSNIFGEFEGCILDCAQYTSEDECINAFDGNSCMWQKNAFGDICVVMNGDKTEVAVPECEKYTDEASCNAVDGCRAVTDLFGGFMECSLDCNKYDSKESCESAFDGSSCIWEHSAFGDMCKVR